MDILLYSGYTIEGSYKIIHYTDDKDNLPLNLGDFKQTEHKGFEFVEFLREAFKGEERGFKYRIQIKDLFYETPNA